MSFTGLFHTYILDHLRTGAYQLDVISTFIEITKLTGLWYIEDIPENCTPHKQLAKRGT